MKYARIVLPLAGAMVFGPVLFVACGGSSSSSNAGADGGGDGQQAQGGDDSGNVVPPGDGGAPDSTGGDDASSQEAGPPIAYAGHVQAQQVYVGDAAPNGGVFAAFPPSGSVEDPLSCLAGSPIMGSCCYLPADLPMEAGVPASLSAGTITVADNDAGFGVLQLQQGTYVFGLASVSRGWMPGDVLGITAAGGVVPAFSGSVLAPPPLEGVTPSLTGLTISLSGDLTVSWTPSPGVPSRVLLDVFAAQAATSAVAKCVVDDSAGTLTIPAGILGLLQPTASTSLTMARGTRSNAMAGSEAIELSVFAAINGTAKLVP
jgi:hypothetical protein